jgi:LmbE family N-acetylglucosaminyl deacetylase
MDVIEAVPESAMVIVAHPDDAEFTFAGTIARWCAAGARVSYVVITRGDKGSDDPEMTSDRLAEIRESEQRAAATILGVAECVFLGYPDAYLQHTLDLRRDVTREIRRFRPEAVLTFDPTVRFFFEAYPNHPDHRVAGDVAIDAVFPAARDRLTFPELLDEGYGPHRVTQLWMAPSDRANVIVDISSVMEIKRRALLSHPSQLGEDEAHFIAELGERMAAEQPFRYGEAYRRIIIE